jgi:hypothetical protein
MGGVLYLSLFPDVFFFALWKKLIYNKMQSCEGFCREPKLGTVEVFSLWVS